ncbi:MULTISPECIES: YacL family protein [Xenorhabdus]|uniref:YacL family protein n=1 Tax=Xenorhabdus TaxID=626 RepID=UPI0006469BEE|nr:MULTISPECIES: YacL family protein [Xenorhabdus]
MKFLIAEDGYPTVEIDYERHVLADFLIGDVQADVSYTDELISLCDSVSNGESSLWEGTGNAHTVTIKPDSVEIFNEYTEESLEIATIEEFKSYLEKWKELLLSRE